MKRLFAISNHGQMLGGGEHSFLDLVSNLPAPYRVLAVVPEKGELERHLVERGMPVKIAALPPLRPSHAHSILKGLRTHVNICRDIRPHLIYANGSRAALYGGLSGRILRIPVIWHCRITDTDPYLDFLLYRLSTRIIANSRATAERFGAGASGKVRVVYNGVDQGWLRQATLPGPELIQEGWKVILVVARTSKWKRHDLTLSAFEMVATSSPLAHLVCVGARDKLEPGWWGHLQERSRRSPFSNRIHWPGQVEDVRPWYKAASVLLLPSDNEPFGRVLVEAMACGVPVIAMRSGGVPEIVRDGQDGFLVRDLSEMVEALSKVLRDEGLRNRLGRSGKERAQIFNLDAHVRGVVKVFEECAKK